MKNILVLTDRSDDVALMSMVLPSALSITHVRDLEAAQALHSRKPFDLIFADIVRLEAAGARKAFLFFRSIHL